MLERNNAVREAGAVRIEKEDLKDKLEEAGRKIEEVCYCSHRGREGVQRKPQADSVSPSKRL